MNKIKLTLANIESVIINDNAGAKVYYTRKKKKSNLFKMRYWYENCGPNRTYCPRCGNIYNITEDNKSECSDCDSEEYQMLDLCDLPDVIWEFLADDCEITIKYWDDTSYILNLKNYIKETS